MIGSGSIGSRQWLDARRDRRGRSGPSSEPYSWWSRKVGLKSLSRRRSRFYSCFSHLLLILFRCFYYCSFRLVGLWAKSLISKRRHTEREREREGGRQGEEEIFGKKKKKKSILKAQSYASGWQDLFVIYPNYGFPLFGLDCKFFMKKLNFL